MRNPSRPPSALAVVAATLLGMSLAGCLGSEGDGADEGPRLPALEMDWSLTRCEFGVALFDVPVEVVTAYVPEGFRVLSVAEVGALANGAPLAPPNPTEGGNFGIEVFDCEEGRGLDGPVQGLGYGSYFTAVEPPADLRRDVDLHFVKWDTLVPDAPRRALLQSYGLPVREGSATVETTFVPGAGSLTSYTGTLDFGGEETLTFEGASLVPQGTVTFVEFMPTAGGMAEWSTSAQITSGGVGPQTVTVPSAGRATDILGGSGVYRGVGFSGIATFADGLIRVPAQP